MKMGVRSVLNALHRCELGDSNLCICDSCLILYMLFDFIPWARRSMICITRDGTQTNSMDLRQRVKQQHPTFLET
jgi:hypothetical protein